MASLFRARWSEEPRSGGKMLRGRRASPSQSPYARPPGSLPAAAQSGSPRWLSGLVSGAGKLISSVLPPYRSSQSQSSSSSSVYSTDEDASSDGYEDIGEFRPSDQGGNVVRLVNMCTDAPQAIVPKSEAKLVIEELLMQESFSRDECDKLTKLIQSRVVDFPYHEVRGNGTEEFRSRTMGNSILSGPLLSFSQKRTLPERAPCSSSKADAFSSRPSIFEVCTPDICNKAVLEAKKWLEEKKLASKPKYDSECGPCTLNTDMLPYGFESEAGSPVDMAKSYMKSLPPWKSPSFSGVGYKIPPPSATRCYKDGASYETADSSLHSFKGLKRDRLCFGSWDTLDETRQVHRKTADDKLEMDKSKQIESSAGVCEHEKSSKSSAEADKTGLSCDATCIDGTFRVPDGKDADANHLLETGNINSLNIVSEQEVTHSSHGISLQILETLEENQPSQTMEKVDNVSVPHDTLALASQLVEHDGNSSSVIKVMATVNIKSAVPSDAVDVDLNDVPTSDTQPSAGLGETVLPGSFSQLNHVSSIAEIDCISDPTPRDGNSHVPKNANGSINDISANSSPAGVNTNHNHETLSKGIDTIMPQNGMRMKSIERTLTEPHVTTTRRGRKVVVKSHRGRKS